MTDAADLERHYRRLLACYPGAFRHDHEQEILSVLMASAEEGQRWPRLAEVADLLRSAISMRLRTRLRTSWAWEYRHRRVIVPVRIVSGIWLVALTAILYGYGVGAWWGLLLIPAATAHFYVAYRTLRHRVES
jgi:Trp operon repressor